MCPVRAAVGGIRKQPWHIHLMHIHTTNFSSSGRLDADIALVVPCRLLPVISMEEYTTKTTLDWKRSCCT